MVNSNNITLNKMASTKSKLSKLKKKKCFKFVGNKKVFTYNGKVRMYNSNTGDFKGWGYSYLDNEDYLGGDKQVLKDRAVEIDFTY